MDDDALIEAAAADAAARVTAIDLRGCAGLMLYTYGEALSAVAWGMPDLEPPLGIAGDSMDELGMLEGHGEAITQPSVAMLGGSHVWAGTRTGVTRSVAASIERRAASGA